MNFEELYRVGDVLVAGHLPEASLFKVIITKFFILKNKEVTVAGLTYVSIVPLCIIKRRNNWNKIFLKNRWKNIVMYARAEHSPDFLLKTV